MGIETAAIGAGGSILGGGLGSKGAKSAGRAGANAANNAANLQALGFQYTAGQLAPYSQLGQSLIPQYQGMANQLWDTSSQALTPLTQGLYGLGFPTGAITSGSNVPTVNQTIGASAQPLTNVTTTAGGFTPFDYQNWGVGADRQRMLESTPGYEFTRNQGLQGVQNSAAATGRGVSGNALAGAANYATGLADSTFNQQLQNAMSSQNLAFGQQLSGEQQAFNQSLGANNQWLNQLQQAFAQDLGVAGFDLSAQQQQFAQQLAHAQALQSLQGQAYGQTQGQIYDPMNALLSGIGLGGNAAAQVGNQSTQAANNMGNYTTQAGNALAGGIAGSASAMQGGLGGASNALTNYLIMNQLGLIPNQSNNYGQTNFSGGGDY